MIRVVTLDTYDEKHVKRLCQILYQAFGVGCEHSGELKAPSGIGDPMDVNALLEQAPVVRAYADDKVLYVTAKKFKERQVPAGVAPSLGTARYGKDRAVITTSMVKNLEDGMKQVARNALHQIGHLWELHHCLDPRCSMYPLWTPSFSQGDAIFCVFCREKSEQKIRLAKS